MRFRAGQRGFTLLEVLLAIAIVASLAAIISLFGVGRMMSTPLGTKCARDLETMRSAAYTWRDERALSDFSTISLTALSADDVRLLSPLILEPAANPWTGAYRMVVDPDNALRFRVYIADPSGHPQRILDQTEKYLRGTYHQKGIEGAEAWFSM